MAVEDVTVDEVRAVGESKCEDGIVNGGAVGKRLVHGVGEGGEGD